MAAITTGKRLPRSVKRWGVTKLQAKGRKTKRGIATLGPWNPPSSYVLNRPCGSNGVSPKIEYNKRILKMEQGSKDVNVKGGFIRYGNLKSSYILIEGSIPGTEKRAIRLRYPARPPLEDC